MKIKFTQSEESNELSVEITEDDGLLAAIAGYINSAAAVQYRQAEEISERLKRTERIAASPQVSVTTNGRVIDAETTEKIASTIKNEIRRNGKPRKEEPADEPDNRGWEPEEGSHPTEAAEPEQPEAKPEEAPAASEEPTDITTEQLRKKILQAATDLGSKNVVAIMKKVAGVSKPGQIPEGKYAAVYSAITDALEAESTSA